MRENKYRAFCETDPWLDIMEVASIDFVTKLVEARKDNGDLCVFKFDEIILMQYTGLKDKNGVEIYEDDIIETPHGYFPVGWLVHQARFAAQYGQVYIRPDNCIRHEVIGNIHKNPELLE